MKRVALHTQAVTGAEDLRLWLIPLRRWQAAESGVPTRAARHIIRRARYALKDCVVRATRSAIHTRRVPLEIRLVQIRAIPKGISANAGDATGYRDARQAGTISECVSANDIYAIADCYVRQAGANCERLITNNSGAFRYRHTRKAGTKCECISANAGDTVANRYICQSRTNHERLVANDCDAVRYCNFCQTGALTERKRINIGNAVGNHHICQRCFQIKRICSNGCHRIAVGGAGDRNIAARTSIACYCDGPVVGGESELRLCCKGKKPQKKLP